MVCRKAYLKPSIQTKKLKIFKNALVDKINFSDRKAIGVTFSQNGRSEKILARREVICSAGSINSSLNIATFGNWPFKSLKKA